MFGCIKLDNIDFNFSEDAGMDLIPHIFTSFHFKELFRVNKYDTFPFGFMSCLTVHIS